MNLLVHFLNAYDKQNWASLKPGAWSSMLVQGFQALGPSSAASQGVLVESWIEGGGAKIELAL